MRPVPPTRKVLAFLRGESATPDVLDDVELELSAALYALTYCVEEQREPLRGYAEACQRMLGATFGVSLPEPSMSFDVELPAPRTCGVCRARDGRRLTNGICQACECVRIISQKAPEPPLTVERLARALWESDLAVQAFVDRVADARVVYRDGEGWAGEAESWRRDAAAERAWERDELGARTRWTERAEAVLERLRGSK